MHTLSELRAWLHSQPDLLAYGQLVPLQILALSPAARSLDLHINERAELLKVLAKHAVDGYVSVRIYYRSSGWGYDDASVRETSVKATVRDYEGFINDLRSDCDGCDAWVELV